MAQRPIWKGHISFGLVTIPITLYSGEKRTDLHFHMLDSRNQARVRFQRVNEETGEEVPWNEIVRAYEFDSGNYVVVTDEDFRRAAIEATKTIDIESFVNRDAIDCVYFDRPYYLVAGTRGEKGYVLLRETLQRTGKVGIAKVVIHSRQYLAALIPQGDALVLDLMRFQQEVRDPSEFDLPRGDIHDYKVSDREINMAEQLVASMTAEWNPAEYHDEYRDALMSWIERKAQAGGMVPGRTAAEEARESGGAEIIDIMDLLKRSMEQAETQRGPTGAAGPATARRGRTTHGGKRRGKG